MTATDQDQELQTTGTITYDLGLTAVIDLDHDPVFAGLSASNRQRVLRRLSRVMVERGEAFFDEFAQYHQITMPEGDDPEGDALAALLDSLVSILDIALDDDEEEAS